MSNNGSSYQKTGDVGNGGNGTPPTSSGLLGGWKKYAGGAVLVAILSTVYLVSSGPNPASTKAAMHKEMTASDLSFDKNGKLKLFDSHSKSFLGCDALVS